jgi:hypothetical protein
VLSDRLREVFDLHIEDPKIEEPVPRPGILEVLQAVPSNACHDTDAVDRGGRKGHGRGS